MTSETNLIYKARHGDFDALNELLNIYKHFAYTIAFNMVKNEFNAKDIVQNAFINTFKSINRFNNESKFSTWLYSIVYRESIRLIQKEQIKNERETEIENINTDFYGINDSFNKLQQEERSRVIRTALKELSPNESALLTLHYLEEKSVREIQKITGLSKSNIKVILYRARTKLYKILNKMLNVEVESIL